jgi:acetylornithine/N-succinyldiaminopimelate aminotransferase
MQGVCEGKSAGHPERKAEGLESKDVTRINDNHQHQQELPMSLNDREAATFFHTYKRLPLEIERGEGVTLIAKDGKRYLDMFSGLAVNALGYAHPAVTKAIAEQAGRFTHLSNYFLQETQIRLAELLTSQSGYPKVFFCNSGTEAIEGAIKLARRWGLQRGKKEILAMSNAFHGRTLGALSVMDRPKYRDGFGPFLGNCSVIQFNDTAALEKSVNDHTAAVLLEFIQGEGGIRMVTQEYASTLKRLQQKFGFLVIADEIQSGLGRTGKFFGFQHFPVSPDVVTMAKPIGGGLPLGAILAREDVASVLQPGMHGTTFGGNPVACAAGVAVMEEFIGKNLMAHAEAMGVLLKEGFEQLKKEFPAKVKEVRVLGLMAGLELDRPGDPVVDEMRSAGTLINCTDTTVLRFLPPLIVEAGHIATMMGQLRTAIGRL